MAFVSRILYRSTNLGLVLCIFAIVSIVYQCHFEHHTGRNGTQRMVPKAKPSTSYGTDSVQRLNLDENECRATYPALLSELSLSSARGPFPFNKSNPDYKGLVQARIENNNLYILTTSPDTLPQIIHQRTAILSQIHRALLTSPTILPTTTFAFTINDVPKNNTWAFSRPNKPTSYNIYPMPPFASWSWPSHNLGPLDSTLTKISTLESSLPFPSKIPKLIWRGTHWFNPLAHPSLRKDLLAATRNKPWADVAALRGTSHTDTHVDTHTDTHTDTNTNTRTEPRTSPTPNPNQPNTTTKALAEQAKPPIPIHHFCKYKYILYTEGVTYSGRLPYHQACNSVLLMAPLTWRTPSAALIKPIWARDLMRSNYTERSSRKSQFERRSHLIGSRRGQFELSSEHPTPEEGIYTRVRQASSVGDVQMAPNARSANAVYVAADFGDLEDVILYLQSRPDVAERIAGNMRRGVVEEGGYLSGQAEVCYWRALVRAWSGNAVVEQGEWSDMLGERFETWLLREVSRDRGGGGRGKVG